MIEGFSGEHSFLSNFWPAEVHMPWWIAAEGDADHGLVYPTVEHAYQAGKCRDDSQREQVRCLSTPGKAKAFGKTVLLRDDWDRIKVNLMRDLIKEKFYHAELREMLLATGDEFIEETNTWGDMYWGRVVLPDGDHVGTNMLGILLMFERKSIQSVL